MNNRKNFLILLMLLPLAGFVLAFLLFPSQIPMHYGISGVVERVGSVFEMLIFFAFSLILGGIGLTIIKYTDTTSKAWLCAMLPLAVVNLAFVYVLAITWYTLQGMQPISLIRYGCMLFGLLMVGIGFMFHKSKLNSGNGLRTHWSLKNEAAWSITQRWSGILFVLGGLMIFVEAILFIEDIQMLTIACLTFVLCYALCVFSSWRAAKRVRF